MPATLENQLCKKTPNIDVSMTIFIICVLSLQVTGLAACSLVTASWREQAAESSEPGT